MAAADPAEPIRPDAPVPPEVATARVDLTPERPVAPAGYGWRAGQTAPPAPPGTLQGAVLALRQAGREAPALVLVTLDTLFVDAAFETALRARAGLGPGTALIVVASHTHAGPNLLTRPLAGAPPDAAARARAIETLGAALHGLVATPTAWRPVTAIARARAPGPGNVNRRRVGWHLDLRRRRPARGCHFAQNPHGAADPDIHALRIDDARGPVALLWCYAAHPAFAPAATDPGRATVDADFPGRARAALAAAHPGLAVLYWPGLAGSVVPSVPRRSRTGRPLRDAVLALPFTSGLGSHTPESWAAWTGRLTATLRALPWRPCPATLGPAGGAVVASVFEDAAPPLPVHLTRAHLGGVALTALSGEPLAEWPPYLPALPVDGIATGYAAGPPAYLAPPALLGDGGYEVAGFQAPFGVTGRMAPDADARLDRALRGLP
ncbi:MAG: hypothetical protein ACU0CO_04735 [Shimia sp.]